jgi:hypothetical protein
MNRLVTYNIVSLLIMGLMTVPVEARRRSSSSGSYTTVRPSITRNGTYRQGHVRTNPNTSRMDNWSTKGNVNPYTGKKGSRNPW